ncbi:hypothetical protein [Brevundimonas aveniformis]|uniref:hypothetical protein n=1 Tax=Brevundimonas aveniformis TaxID=370977 RepID=UPI002492E41E|nr:hypothetical protein [Brevundimonas aveniformis]
MFTRTLIVASAVALAACSAEAPVSEDPPPSGDTAAAPTEDAAATASGEDPSAPPATDAGERPVPRPAEASDTQCRQGERALYNCRFDDGRVASVCSSERNSYRYGPLGDPEIDISRVPGEPGVWQTTVVGQGGGHQTHIRFRNDGYDYIVLSGEDGRLADNPGRVYSGVVVMRGEEEVARLDCPVTSYQTDISASMIPNDIPTEAEGGEFDAWF